MRTAQAIPTAPNDVVRGIATASRTAALAQVV